jgi:membrane protease YdiL (CAAX protease family)
MVALALMLLAWRDARRSPGALRPRLFVLMLLESAVLAVVFGFVVGVITAQLLNALPLLAIGQLEQMSWPVVFMVSLGAGLYEELVFRVLLVSALLFLGKTVLGLGRAPAVTFAVVLGALIFSGFHYIGPSATRSRRHRSSSERSPASPSVPSTSSVGSA